MIVIHKPLLNFVCSVIGSLVHRQSIENVARNARITEHKLHMVLFFVRDHARKYHINCIFVSFAG